MVPKFIRDKLILSCFFIREAISDIEHIWCERLLLDIEPSVMGGGGHDCSHHNFVVVAPMITKFDTCMKLDVFYTMATKICDITTVT